MGNKRLSDLLVIAVESFVSCKIDLDDAVDVFSKMKKRRYSLIN
jgi:sulfite reductase alpha subunit-like flavoprotein